MQDVSDRSIPGLYAAGELVGGLFYENYPGGSGLMAGSVFGKLAGESAAASTGHKQAAALDPSYRPSSSRSEGARPSWFGHYGCSGAFRRVGRRNRMQVTADSASTANTYSET